MIDISSIQIQVLRFFRFFQGQSGMGQTFYDDGLSSKP